MKTRIIIISLLVFGGISVFSQEDVNPNGLRILDNTNPIRFSSFWSGFPDNATNRAEICNDVNTYKTLMIVGNFSAGLGKRRVSIWDRLEVNGNLFITENLLLGNVVLSGVGTSTPQNISLGSTFGTNSLGTNFKLKLFESTESFYNYGLGVSNSLFEVVAGRTGSIAFFTDGSSERMRIDVNGNVGIGTPTPQNTLDVNGTIRAKEVKVETGWADFVFAPTYKLRPLAEVEQFIKANGHLPEIPKAEEVQQNCVNLGEMQLKLLQKVEELTLYSIEMEKADAELRQQLATQAKEIEILKQIIKQNIK